MRAMVVEAFQVLVSDGSENYINSQTKYPIRTKHSGSLYNIIHSDSDISPEQSGIGGTMHSLCGTLLIAFHPGPPIT
jgi:hypothetical protein